jgi:parallel beta-helix repeat protein
VYALTATITLQSNRIFENHSEEGGGVWARGGSATLNKNEVYSNSIQSYGGGVLLYKNQASLNMNVIHHNTAPYTSGSGGGGVYAQYGTATLSANTIYSNTSNGDGGGIWINNIFDVTLTNNTIMSNTSTEAHGGGISLWDSDGALLDGNQVIANHANDTGGGLRIEQSHATLTNNSFIFNTAEVGSGGGVAMAGRAVTMTANTVLSNTAVVGGGLSLEWNDAILNQNTISYNRTPASGGEGGGIFMGSSHPSMNGNIITFNYAANWGGGLALYQDSAPVLVNNVVADNIADEYGSGIAVRIHSNPRLYHTTIARNQGGDGSGISLLHGELCRCTVEMTNTIVMSHTVGITVAEFSTVTMVGTLWYNNTTNWDGAGALDAGAPNVYTNPLFDTDGYHLTAGSGAINQGVLAGVTVDIDGQSRDAQPDLGADEYVVCVPLTGASITGPTKGFAGMYYAFTAAITPTGATPPILYTWSPTPAIGQGSPSATYSWDAAGDQTLSVTASNCGGAGSASDDHVITIVDIEFRPMYLPIMWKVWP